MKKALIACFAMVAAARLAVAAPPTIEDVVRSVPDNAGVVLAVDSAKLRDVPWVQEWLLRHQAWTGADDELRTFLADAGLDPVRDVDAMVVAVLGEGPATGGVAFFSGRYDPSSLGAALVKHGATALKLGETPAYVLPHSGHGDGKTVVLALPSAELAVVGDEAAVRAALTASRRVVAPLVEREVAAGHIDLRAPFWVVANVPKALRARAGEAAGKAEGGGDDSVRGVLAASGSVQRVAMQAFLDDSLKVSGVAVADTSENAELLRDALKGAIAVARLHAQQQHPDLVKVLRDVQVQVAANEVSAAASIPLTLLEKVMAGHASLGCSGSHGSSH